MPDITVRERKGNEVFFLVACDGIWDIISNEKCMRTINKAHKENEKRKLSCLVADIMENGIAKSVEGPGLGTDNMTGILVYFENEGK